ncbi:MAG: hypothetical protein HY855_25960 [Burkholderiales bacterium]|nr:hypothetical protein [Burkholderiales bacterium]
MTTAALSFEVRMARSAEDLREACMVRVAGYGHHLPQLKKALAEPDEIDHERGTAVLVCLDKASGRGVGTARIQRAGADTGVQLESSVRLPDWLAQRPRAEITRLAIVPGADALVRPMLMKASYLYCLASQARWMVIGARSEALVRMYRRLGFTDVLAEEQTVPLAHAGGLQHRILAMDVIAAERTWYQGQHGMYELMIETYHPDIQLMTERRAWPQPQRVAA